LLVDGFPRPVPPDSSGNSPVRRSASRRRRDLQRFVSGDTEGVGPSNRIEDTANQRSDEPPAHNGFKSLGLGQRLDLEIDPFVEKSAQKAPHIAHQSQGTLLVDGFPRPVPTDSSFDSPDGRRASPRRRNFGRLFSGDAGSIESSRETMEAAMQNSDMLTMACRLSVPANGSLLQRIPSPRSRSKRQREPTCNQRKHGQRRRSPALRLLTVRVAARVGRR